MKKEGRKDGRRKEGSWEAVRTIIYLTPSFIQQDCLEHLFFKSRSPYFPTPGGKSQEAIFFIL
jgi:hypothetical protein